MSDPEKQIIPMNNIAVDPARDPDESVYHWIDQGSRFIPVEWPHTDEVSEKFLAAYGEKHGDMIRNQIMGTFPSDVTDGTSISERDVYEDVVSKMLDFEKKQERDDQELVRALLNLGFEIRTAKGPMVAVLPERFRKALKEVRRERKERVFSTMYRGPYS